MKSQFFANVSHELRTPLSLIMGLVQKLEASTSSEQEGDLEAIHQNSRLLLNQVNDLLEASRLEAGKGSIQYRVLDLARLARLTCSHFGTLAEDRGLTFITDIPERLMIEGDGDKLERILLNFIGECHQVCRSWRNAKGACADKGERRSCAS